MAQRGIVSEGSSRALRYLAMPGHRPSRGQQCGASLVVAHDHDDSEHSHDSRDDLDDKPEATTLLATAFTVSHWPILAITRQWCVTRRLHDHKLTAFPQCRHSGRTSRNETVRHQRKGVNY
jgi:hypothetical protein